MRSEWQWVKLGDHCVKIGSGATPKGGKDSYFIQSQFSLIRSQNIYNDGFVPQGLAFISENQAKKLDSVAVEVGDVLLNITGDSVARVCMAPEDRLPARVNQHVVIVRTCPNSLDSRYLRYFLVSPFQQQIMHGLAASGGTRNALTKGMIEAFKVPCPPLPEQKQIADTLSSLDNIIGLNRQTNATLEAIAQALFKSWFIDFDPVRAKMEGRQPEGMDDATAALFPSEFVESELGLIPKGWSVDELSKHVEVERGISYKGAGLREVGEGMPMHNLNSVYEGGGYKYPGIKFYAGHYADRHVALAGDIIVANTEQGHKHRLIGFPAIVPKKYAKAIYSHHIYRVRPRNESPMGNLAICYTLMAPYVRQQIIGFANGSTVNMLKMAGLQTPKFVCPLSEILQVFDGLVCSLHNSIEKLTQESENLANIRDTLLPKLISGQLRIPEAMDAVENSPLPLAGEGLGERDLCAYISPLAGRAKRRGLSQLGERVNFRLKS